MQLNQQMHRWFWESIRFQWNGNGSGDFIFVCILNYYTFHKFHQQISSPLSHHHPYLFIALKSGRSFFIDVMLLRFFWSAHGKNCKNKMQDRINSQKKHGNRYELLLKSESFHRNYVRFGLGFFIYSRSFFVTVGIYQQYVMLGCFHRHCHQMGHPFS